MLSARKTRALSNIFANPDLLFKRGLLRQLVGVESNVREEMFTLAGNISSNMLNGFTNTTTYYRLAPSTINILRSHGYEVTEEREDDVAYYVISWENAA